MKIQVLLIILTICGSNKFTQQELLGLIQTFNSEYLKTNSYAKYDYKFNIPKIVRLKNGVFTRKIIDEIKKAKFGVILRMVYYDDSDDDNEIEKYELGQEQMYDTLNDVKNSHKITENELYGENHLLEDESDDDENYQFESD